MQKQKKEVYEVLKKEQSVWNEQKNIAKVCRDVTEMAKVLLELNLTKDIKNNKKRLLQMHSSDKTRKNVSPLLDWVGVPVLKKRWNY